MISSIICRQCGSGTQLLDVFGDIRCLNCWGADRLNAVEAARLLKEAQALVPGTGPWKVDESKNAGENWMIAMIGEDYEGKRWMVTTDQTHASDMGASGPQEDAEFIVWCRNHWRELRQALAMAAAVDTPS